MIQNQIQDSDGADSGSAGNPGSSLGFFWREGKSEAKMKWCGEQVSVIPVPEYRSVA